MKSYFSPKLLLFIFVSACIVLGAALLLPTPQNESLSEETPHNQVEEPNGESISDLFETDDEPQFSKNTIPTDIPKDEACNINGHIVREGTVASNTICVNEQITPQP